MKLGFGAQFFHQLRITEMAIWENPKLERCSRDLFEITAIEFRRRKGDNFFLMICVCKRDFPLFTIAFR